MWEAFENWRFGLNEKKNMFVFVKRFLLKIQFLVLNRHQCGKVPPTSEYNVIKIPAYLVF